MKYEKAIRVAVVPVIVLCIVGVLNSCRLFDDPTKEVIKTDCDSEGMRQAVVFKFAGNTTANPSIHVLVKSGCGNFTAKEKEELIFTADKSFINGDELVVEWTSFDTLTITYDAALRIFEEKKQIAFQDTTLNFVVKYKRVE